MKKLLLLLQRSLPARMLLCFSLVGTCIIVLMFGILFHGFSFQWKNNVRPHFEQYLDYINTDIGNPPNLDRAQQLVKQLPINIYIKGPNINYTSTGIDFDLTEVEFSSGHNKWNDKHHRQPHNRQVTFAEYQDRMVMRNQVGDYQVFYELSNNRENAKGYVFSISALVILLILAGSFFVLKRMLRPVQDIKKGVQLMGQGQLDYRLPIRSNNDLGDLANSINAMAADIEQMLDAKRQLLLAVSHELRSPLTRAKIATQMLDPSLNRERLQEDLMEMETLITEILETERMKTPHAALSRSPVHLESLIQSVIDELPDNNVSLNVPQQLPVLDLDEKRMRLLMRNLMGNAILHGGDVTPAPSVQLTYRDQQLQITVRDHGPGIAEADLMHVTEPFYRADPSRTRNTGGFGIGLYLCKLIAQAHGGELLITSELGSGTCVEVLVPGGS
ncbi:hypothetical protein A9R01_16225 ['Osedax' symbiont bacterium Rs2_46_30_T18]|nr:hypothetical protein A9R01_16225 ['Osedax' symbiont bacterium Rs2_46_30_T18]